MSDGNYCMKPHSCFAYLVLRTCQGHASSTANFRRQLPSRAPSSFPFQIEPLPHSYIHLPNTILTSPSLDIFHSFSVPNTTFPSRSYGAVTHLFLPCGVRQSTSVAPPQ